jgi:hypothetical protein
MAHESTRLKRVATRELRFGIYELRLSEEEEQRFSDDAEAFLAELIVDEGEPAPNKVIVHRAADPSIGDLISEIFTIARAGDGGGGTPPTPPPGPPVAIVLHQESGVDISRYFTLVAGPSP